MTARVRRAVPAPRPLSATERLQLRAGELVWTLAWCVMAGAFRDVLGAFVCGLVCAWGLFELERWVEAGRG